MNIKTGAFCSLCAVSSADDLVMNLDAIIR